MRASLRQDRSLFYFGSCGTVITMNTLPITITKKEKANKTTFMVEFDADRFEQVAAALGMFSDEFVASIDRAEADIKAGRVHKVSSLRELR